MTSIDFIEKLGYITRLISAVPPAKGSISHNSLEYSRTYRDLDLLLDTTMNERLC